MHDILLSIRHNAGVLSLFALITISAIVSVKVLTETRIHDNQIRSEHDALNHILPPYKYDNDLLTTTVDASALTHLELLGGGDHPRPVHLALRKGKLVAVVIELRAPNAYTRPIELLLGIYVDGTVAGTRVLSHQETPGLGDQIDVKKSNWINTFTGKALTSENERSWAVKKDGGDIDQFTGATITPRAITQAIKQGLQFFAHNIDRIQHATALSQGNRL